MISINKLSYYIGSRVIFENAGLHITEKDKIGLIGLNGTGKSTLLKIIMGQLSIDEGDISKANTCTIGYLDQDLLSVQSDDSILTTVMGAFEREVEIERQLEKVVKQLETDYSDQLINKLARLQELYEQVDGYTLQSRAEEILEGVGFSTSDLHRPMSEFSGGWRMRVVLARLLLERPSLLLLDEPTNHLDLPSIKWLEEYLVSYPGAYIIVSHDKHFLNRTVTKVAEISGGKINLYVGDYSHYEAEKEERNFIQKNAFENQQQKIKQTERFIERFRAKSTKARQVQSRVKALEQMDRVDDIIDTNPTVHFKFNFSTQSGKLVNQLSNLSKAYGDNIILQNTGGEIMRGDKIALIGANGKGKSTLLRIVNGSEPFDGETRSGHNVISSFYAQHQIEALTLELDILEELKQSGSKKTEQELRGVLGCFLFSGDDVFKKIKVLSGGEKSRVALAKTLISESNFLLLDEPTNHLDIQSINVLINALNQYEGTVLLVSHDRHFISQVANKIWYIENHELKEYPGTYEEYEYFMAKKNTNNKPATPVLTNNTKKEPDKNSIQNREQQKELGRLKKKLSKLEEEIEGLESEMSTLEEEMAKPEVYSNPDKLATINETLETRRQLLEEKNDEWAQLGEQIEEMEG